jgi:hypothetical protein
MSGGIEPVKNQCKWSQGRFMSPRCTSRRRREICSTVETGTGSILFLTGTILWWLAEKYAVSPLRDNELSLIGMVYQKQKNTPAARKQLQRTLQLNPNFPQADKIRKTQDSQNLDKINA